MSGIYHYTDIRTSLPSILKAGGLLSRAEMDAREVKYVGHGWGRPGKELELEDFICCSLVPNWGMLRKETEPQAVLELQTDLIWREGTLFCPGNSAYNAFSLDNLRDKNTVEAFDAMFDNPYSDFPNPYDCEVMVYRSISLDNLRVIHFQTEGARDQGVAIIREVLSDQRIRERVESILPLRTRISPRLYPQAR
jgi:hypothetical protein